MTVVYLVSRLWLPTQGQWRDRTGPPAEGGCLFLGMATNAQLPYLRPLGYDCTISSRPAFPVQAVANLTDPIERVRESEREKEKNPPFVLLS